MMDFENFFCWYLEKHTWPTPGVGILSFQEALVDAPIATPAAIFNLYVTRTLICLKNLTTCRRQKTSKILIHWSQKVSLETFSSSWRENSRQDEYFNQIQPDDNNILNKKLYRTFLWVNPNLGN